MLTLLDKSIEEYLQKNLPPRDEVLLEMERLGDERDFPYVGPQVGSLMFQVAKMIGAKNVFEMGSGYGYSAVWFARALPEGGQVILTEYKASHAKEAEGFLKRAGVAHKTKIEVGDAHEIIERYSGPFDIVFIDCDKEKYPRAFDQALPRVRAGGAIIADNLLWGGRVAGKSPDASTRGILEYTRKATHTPGVHTTILPLRDGVGISLKLS